MNVVLMNFDRYVKRQKGVEICKEWGILKVLSCMGGGRKPENVL